MKTKKTYLFSLIAIFILSVLHVGAKDIDDKQYKFKITVPDHWKSSNAMDGTDKVYDFLSPDEMAFIQLRAFKAGAGLSMDLLVDVYEENYLPKGSKRSDLVNKTSTNGIPGKNGTYLVSDNGFDVGISVFYVIQNGQGYTLSVIVPTTMAAYYEKDIKSIAQSFVIPGFERKTQEENVGIAINENSDANSGGLGGLSGITQEESGSNNTSSENLNEIEPFRGLEILNVRMGNELLSDTEVLNAMTTFLPQTENIYAVFDWQGEGASGHEMKIAWFYDQNNYKIDETTYRFPDFETQGTNNSVLSMPYQGWPVGDYYIEFSVAGQIVYEYKFTISEEIQETTQADFASESDFGYSNQSDEKNLFEGTQSKGKAQIVFDHDDYDEPDAKPKKSKSKRGDISGRYDFVKRSDGKVFSNYHFIEIRSDGTYTEEHNPINSGDYKGGQSGTWSRDGDKVILTHSGGITDHYRVDGKELISEDREIIFYFKRR